MRNQPNFLSYRVSYPNQGNEIRMTCIRQRDYTDMKILYSQPLIKETVINHDYRKSEKSDEETQINK